MALRTTSPQPKPQPKPSKTQENEKKVKTSSKPFLADPKPSEIESSPTKTLEKQEPNKNNSEKKDVKIDTPNWESRPDSDNWPKKIVLGISPQAVSSSNPPKQGMSWSTPKNRNEKMDPKKEYTKPPSFLPSKVLGEHETAKNGQKKNYVLNAKVANMTASMLQRPPDPTTKQAWSSFVVVNSHLFFARSHWKRSSKWRVAKTCV